MQSKELDFPFTEEQSVWIISVIQVGVCVSEHSGTQCDELKKNRTFEFSNCRSRGQN